MTSHRSPFSLLPSLFSRRAAPVSPGAQRRSLPARSAGFSREAARRGFTMLELVAVIGIIAVMSVIVISGFSGISRSLSAQAGTDSLKRFLMLAGQQACVDGVDTYVWVTGVDSFVIVRRAGTVCHEPTKGTRKPDYLQNGGEFSASSNWIVDDYADLSNASQSFRFDSSTTAEDKQAALDAYAAGETVMLVFDMDAAKTAVIEYPPFFDSSLDAWVFGVKSIPSGAFKLGHAYGWLAMPEQRLPKGFSFDVPYEINKSTGDVTVDANKAPHVHFRPDGSVEQDVTFILKDASGNASRPRVKVNANGKIEASTK